MKPPWGGSTVASRTITPLQDDIDGSDANQTVRFAIDGTEYEIDLSERNAIRFRESIAEFVGHARKIRKAASSLRADMGQARHICGGGSWSTATGYQSEAGFQPGCNRFILFYAQ